MHRPRYVLKYYIGVEEDNNGVYVYVSGPYVSTGSHRESPGKLERDLYSRQARRVSVRYTSNA